MTHASASETHTVSHLSSRFYKRVYAFALRLTDPVTAEDVAQETFLRLLRMDQLESKHITSSYLIKIAHNIIKGQARQGRRFQRYMTNSQADASRIVESGPDAGVGAISEIELKSLTQQEQDAVRLTVCHGLSLKEASESLGVRVTTVTNWKYRGLRKLAHSGRAPEAA